LLPLITTIVNQSLSSGKVPDTFKVAFITPILKNPSLDASVLSNYKPISNLPFLSKVLEKVVNDRLNEFMEEEGCQELYQSAYRKGHSTETALLRVHNDILRALSEKRACLMLLLDLSAAFDTVDHSALIDTLSAAGLRDSALEWFRSYLSDRYQCVSIGTHRSGLKPLRSGVPQGSVLGPVLFSLYTSSLGKLIQTHSLSYHLYADDTSIYITFETPQLTDAVARMECCAEDVRRWMSL
jgi:hypothetical protein